MHPSTSVSLLARLRRVDDVAAWERFVLIYTPLLFHWAKRTGLTDAQAEDLVQDIFVILIQRMPTFDYDPTQSFHRWLRTVVMNRWRDRAAAEAVRRAAPLKDEPVEPDGLDTFIEEEYRGALARRALEVMRRDFTESTWRACWEMVVEGRSAAEVAADLGITEGAAHAARCRVLRRLRQELAGLL